MEALKAYILDEHQNDPSDFTYKLALKMEELAPRTDGYYAYVRPDEIFSCSSAEATIKKLAKHYGLYPRSKAETLYDGLVKKFSYVLFFRVKDKKSFVFPVFGPDGIWFHNLFKIL